MKLILLRNISSYFGTTAIVLCFGLVLNINNFAQSKNSQNNFNLGYSSLVFQDVDPRDGNAALLIYSNQLEQRFLQKHKTKVILNANIYYSIEEIRTGLRNNSIDLLSIPVDQYFELKKEFNLVPCLSVISNNEKFTQYVIIVSSVSKIKNVGDLNGVSFVIPKNYIELVSKWVNLVLYKNNLKGLENNFSSVNNTISEKNAVYDIFFNKKDCAVVRKSVLNTLYELNPQLKSSILEIERSPDIIPTILAYKKDSAKNLINLVIQESLEIPSTPEGRKILEIFKANSINKIDNSDLENANGIITEFNKIKAKLK